MIDPIVEEIRHFRNDQAKKFNDDLDAICEDFKKHQLIYRHRLVRLKPKKMPHKPVWLTAYHERKYA